MVVIGFHTQATWPMRKNHSTHWMGNRVGPRASLDRLENITTSFPYQDLNPRLSSLQHNCYTDHTTPAPSHTWSKIIYTSFTTLKTKPLWQNKVCNNLRVK
jgi:hypothetical protein